MSTKKSKTNPKGYENIIEFPEPNANLGIEPTEDIPESQYEAYQSVYSTIMGDNRVYDKICKKEDIKYILYPETETEESVIKNINKSSDKDGTVYIIVQDIPETHYKAFIKGNKIAYDPYNYYQIDKTHGLCQTFALYLAFKYRTSSSNAKSTTLPPDLKVIQKPNLVQNFKENNRNTRGSTSDKSDYKKKWFDRYVCNTVIGTLYMIDYIRKNPDIKRILKTVYNEEKVKSTYGFKDVNNPINFDKFLTEFEMLSNYKDVRYHIYDCILAGLPIFSDHPYIRHLDAEPVTKERIIAYENAKRYYKLYIEDDNTNSNSVQTCIKDKHTGGMNINNKCSTKSVKGIKRNKIKTRRK